MKQTTGMKSLRIKIAIGYSIILVLIGGIVCTYLYEWKKMEGLENESRQIDSAHQNIHSLYVRIAELSLISETVMEWTERDSKLYHRKQIELDSLLSGMKTLHPHQGIDSMRYLLADKEELLHHIALLFEKQETTNQEIAKQVPAIARKSTQQATSKKRGGFLGLFKKKLPEPATTTTMLHSFNKNVIARQQQQSRLITDYTDSLSTRNKLLNSHLKELINQIDAKGQSDLQQRKQTITATREETFRLISLLTAIVLVLLILSYIIIYRYSIRIRQYKISTNQLIKKLKHAVQENQDLLLARRKIMFTVTHELRTPLTAISGYAELISNETDRSRHDKYAETIQLASTRMVSLLNTLLNFFRLDCGKEQANPAPFHLQSIVETLNAEFLPQAKNKGIALAVTSCNDAVAFGDKERIIQIGSNLLSNAIKFTEKGTVTLKTEYSHKRFVLTVSDTGTGISEQQQQQIFTPFERLSNAATQDGFGLGLSIVRNIVKLLDGTIDLQSVEGEGCTFTARLPMPLAGNSLQEKEILAEKESIRPFSVLAFDNDEVLLAMTREMFARYGITCHTCLHVNELMENIRAKNYDLLITDLKMPEMNGFDVLELLRTSQVGNSRTIPVILVTASGSCRTEEVRAAGFAALLNKPFSSAELIETARGCIVEIHQEEKPDLSPLLAYGNKMEVLDRLIRETEKEMKQVAQAAERNDRKALGEWMHHLRSSWSIIHADKPLWDLYGVLQAPSKSSDEALHRAVDGVLAKGEDILQTARKRKEEHE